MRWRCSLLCSPLMRIDPAPLPNFVGSDTTTITSGILIVEDERIVAKDIQQMVSGLGYSVVGIAVSGEDAVQKANMLLPALILMDIWLPGAIDGIRAADEIREVMDVPVIWYAGTSEGDIHPGRSRRTGRSVFNRSTGHAGGNSAERHHL